LPIADDLIMPVADDLVMPVADHLIMPVADHFIVTVADNTVVSTTDNAVVAATDNAVVAATDNAVVSTTHNAVMSAADNAVVTANDYVSVSAAHDTGPPFADHNAVPAAHVNAIRSGHINAIRSGHVNAICRRCHHDPVGRQPFHDPGSDGLDNRRSGDRGYRGCHGKQRLPAAKPVQIEPHQALPSRRALEDQQRILFLMPPELPHLFTALVHHAEFVHLPLADRRVEVELQMQERQRGASRLEHVCAGPALVERCNPRHVPGRRVVQLGLLSESG